MAAWTCESRNDSHDGGTYVILTGPSNADGIGACARHLGELTQDAIVGRAFVVVAAPGEIPEYAVRSNWRKAS